MFRAVSRLSTSIAGLPATRHSVIGIAHPPFRHGARRAANFPRDRTGARARRRQQYNPGPRSHIRVPLLREPASASSTLRSATVKATAVAGGIGFFPMTNHDSRFSESGY
jgi:hypothetical protein